MGCSTDYALDVGSGYSLERANEDEIYLVDANRKSVVPGKVIELGIAGDVVYGYVAKQSWRVPDEVLSADVVVGFFWLDTRTNQVRRGLSKRQLLKLVGTIKMSPPTCKAFESRCRR
ncbi:hypothetical protein YWS52_36180 [Chitiniphilus shinanonensis]